MHLPNIPGLGEPRSLSGRATSAYFLTLPLNSTRIMSVALQHVPSLNGLNGASTDSKKAKSRNQLRRQKAKQKKTTARVRR